MIFLLIRSLFFKRLLELTDPAFIALSWAIKKISCSTLDRAWKALQRFPLEVCLSNHNFSLFPKIEELYYIHLQLCYLPYTVEPPLSNSVGTDQILLDKGDY